MTPRTKIIHSHRVSYDEYAKARQVWVQVCARRFVTYSFERMLVWGEHIKHGSFFLMTEKASNKVRALLGENGSFVAEVYLTQALEAVAQECKGPSQP